MTRLDTYEAWFFDKGPGEFKRLAVVFALFSIIPGIGRAAEIQSAWGYLAGWPFLAFAAMLFLLGQTAARRSTLSVPLAWLGFGVVVAAIMAELPALGSSHSYSLAIDYALTLILLIPCLLAALFVTHLWRRGAFQTIAK